MNKIALWISNYGNDWIAESAMIASNGLKNPIERLICFSDN